LALLAAGCRKPRVLASPGVEPEAAVKGCLDAKDAAREEARRGAPACTYDFECGPVLPAYLGCSVFAPADRALERRLEAQLLDACTGVGSRRADCKTTTSDCVEGRCVKAGPEFRADACTVAVEEAIAWADQNDRGCTSDDECTLVRLGTSTASVRWAAHDLPQAVRAARDDCRGSAPQPEDLRPRCDAGRCVVRSGSTFTRPSIDIACVRREVKVRMYPGADLRVTARFVVGVDGRMGFFSFDKTFDPGVEAAIAAGILQCKATPGTRDGAPVPIWIVLPIQFVSGPG
jgi:hypothetical protein